MAQQISFCHFSQLYTTLLFFLSSSSCFLRTWNFQWYSTLITTLNWNLKHVLQIMPTAKNYQQSWTCWENHPSLVLLQFAIFKSFYLNAIVENPVRYSFYILLILEEPKEQKCQVALDQEVTSDRNSKNFDEKKNKNKQQLSPTDFFSSNSSLRFLKKDNPFSWEDQAVRPNSITTIFICLLVKACTGNILSSYQLTDKGSYFFLNSCLNTARQSSNDSSS